MYRTLALFFVFFMPFVGNSLAHASLWDSIKHWFATEECAPPPLVRILIGDDLESALLEVDGRYALYDPFTNEHISNRFLGKSETMESQRFGLKWGEEFPGIYQLEIRPLDPTTVIRINGVDFQGNVYVYDTEGMISLVNEIDLEEYLLCTLPFSVTEDLSKEAMAALAIAARTNAYFQVMHPRNPYWTVDAKHVGFHGSTIPHSPKVVDSIYATKHMVLSSTGPYDGKSTPFLSSWGSLSTLRSSGSVVQGKITLKQAEEMAERGAHAAQILSKAFPGSSVMLTQNGE